MRDAVEALKNVLAAALDSKSLEAESLAAKRSGREEEQADSLER